MFNQIHEAAIDPSRAVQQQATLGTLTETANRLREAQQLARQSEASVPRMDAVDWFGIASSAIRAKLDELRSAAQTYATEIERHGATMWLVIDSEQ